MRAGKRCDIPKLFEENTTIRRPFKTDAPVKDGPRSNREIRIPKVQLINEEGVNLGVIATDQALRMAEEAGLDLVEISPNAEPPVCKILDLGKLKYANQKKAAEARRKQKIVEVKEIKMRPNIDTHDYEVKMKAMNRFFDNECNVVLSDVDAARNRFVTYVSGPREPGSWYLYDRAARSFVNLTPRTTLATERLARTEALDVTTRDGATIRAYDPDYYVAYTITAEPEFTGREDCRAQVFEPDIDAIPDELREAIAELSADTTPESAANSGFSSKIAPASAA